MGLLQKIKSALGLDGGTSSNGRRSEDVDVTVEREPSTEDEDAVKGTDTSASNESLADDDTTAASDSGTTGADDDAAAAGSDTDDAPSEERSDSDGEAASTDVDIEDAEGAAVEEDDESEDAEADGDDESADADEDHESADADADEDHESADAEAEPDGSDDPVTELNGIGPAYAERLSGQGIETVGELAVADAAAIAAETDLGEKRVSDWIAQAREY